MSAISTLGLTVATSIREVRIMPPLYTGAILPVMRHLDHLFASIESLQLLLHIYHLASDFLELCVYSVRVSPQSTRVIGILYGVRLLG